MSARPAKTRMQTIISLAAALLLTASASAVSATTTPPLGVQLLISGRTYDLSRLLPGYENVSKTWRADANKASPNCRIDGGTQLVPILTPTPSYIVNRCELEVVLSTGEKHYYSLPVYPAATPRPQPSPVKLPKYGRRAEARSNGWVAGSLTYLPGTKDPSKTITVDSVQVSLTLPITGDLDDRVKAPGYGANTSVSCYMYDTDSDRRSVASEATWQYPLSDRHFVEMSVRNLSGTIEVRLELHDSETFKIKRLWIYTSKARPGSPKTGKGKVSLVQGYQGAVSKVVLQEIALSADGSYIPKAVKGGSQVAFDGYVACGEYE